jgi:hypothetical protein
MGDIEWRNIRLGIFRAGQSAELHPSQQLQTCLTAKFFDLHGDLSRVLRNENFCFDHANRFDRQAR